MKGIVLQLLGRCAREAFGEDTWRQALAAAGVAEPFDPQRTYLDAEFNAMVSALAGARGISIDDA
jgi:hypothetical protein